MTTAQKQLIENLTAASQWKIARAKFNGDFLNCEADVTVRETGKVKKQKFSFIFDDAEFCIGARLVGKLRGAYSEWYAKAAFEIIVSFSDEQSKLVV